MTRRKFSVRQRRILLWLAAGKCQLCGSKLGRDFHADHIKPYSKCGNTIISNGQALCGPCNLKKGAYL